MDLTISEAQRGLRAAQQRLDTTATAVANAGAVTGSGASGPGTPQISAPLRGVGQSLPGGAATVPSPAVTVPAYQPTSPIADQSGIVSEADVDPVTAGISQMTAAHAYNASAALLRTSGEMQKAMLDSFAAPARRSVSA